MASDDTAIELTNEELQKLAELDQALEKFESQKRWSDVIRTVLAKAEIVRDRAAKTELLRQAGTLYLERSSNQAEAIKCFEAILELDPADAESITRLKEMYEKRRDWERLVRVMQREVELLDVDDRPLRYVEMAQLATEKLRKPEICIELWALVLSVDPENPEALTSLAGLHERARNWRELADVLERLAELSRDDNERRGHLQKLGTIYADKLSDDEGAVRAFQRLLALDPEDRRAQEQLKRRYVALRAWDDLERFFSSSDKWDELIRMLEREAEAKETSDAEKVGLLFRTARLWHEKKDKLDRAARAFEKILELDPENYDAADKLAPIYEQGNDAKRLAGVHEVRLRHIEEVGPRLVLLREVGALYEERLKAPGVAFDKYIEAFVLDPTQELVREDVRRVAPVVEGWARLIEAYERAIDAATDPHVVLDLRLDLGRALADTGRTDAAIEQFRAIHESDPEHEGALEALSELYRKTGRHRELLTILETRLALTTEPDARRSLAYLRAGLLEDQTDDVSPAIEAYREILVEHGDLEADAYRALDRLYEATQRWAELAETLERRIDVGPESDDELAALKCRLGRVLERHLDDAPRAVELYREVLALQPTHAESREALEQLLQSPAVAGAAASVLEGLYESQGQYGNLVRALEVLRASAQDPAEQLDLLRKIGEVFADRLEDAPRAFAAYAAAYREAPEDAELWERLERLTAELDRPRDLFELLVDLAPRLADPVLARTMYLRAATIAHVRVGDAEAAVRAYRQVLETDPADAEVLDALEALFETEGRHRDLLEVLRRKSELADDPTAREALLVRVATLYDEKLAEPQSAIGAYREILELDPASPVALGMLDRLLEREQMWSDLADNIDRQLTLASSPEDIVTHMLRLADLRENRMNAVEAAVEIHREVLDRDPSNERALVALERLLEKSELEASIADILEPIYRDAQQYRKLIGVHEIQARHADSPERRVELLHRIAELFEMGLDSYDEAFRTYARALAEDAANPNTHEQLDRLAVATGAAEALARVYEERADAIEDATLAASLNSKAASIREEQVGDAAGAIARYRRVLELEPRHAEAAESLERLYQAEQRYEDLAATLLLEASIADDPEQRKGYLYRAAALQEEVLERPLDAVATYRRALEVDAEDLTSLDKLIELFLRLERWEDLLGVYTTKVDIVLDPDEKKAIYAEMGAVYERELGDRARAIDTYQRVLELDPEERTALGRLDALYQATENWQELLSVLEREVDLAADPFEAGSYRYRIGELWHRRLSDVGRAIDFYREVLDEQPEHTPSVAALEAIIVEGTEPVAAANVLEPIYQGAAAWERLVHVHEVQAQHEEDPVRRVELLHRVAYLQENELGAPAAAFDAFARSLPFDDENEVTIGSIERLAEDLGNWATVGALYDAQIERARSDGGDRLVDAALRAGVVYEVHLADADAAIERYRVALGADPLRAQAIEALDRLYVATERFADLAEVLRAEIQIAATPDDVLNLQFRLGQVQQSRLGEVDAAIAQYRDILAADPAHVGATGALEGLFAQGVNPLVVADILEPLYRMQENWDRWLALQESQLAYQADLAERVGSMHRMVEVAEERLGDVDRAFLWIQRALLEDPMHDHTLDEVGRLGRTVDGWRSLASTYADAIERTDDVEAKLSLGKRLAEVYENELGDVSRAEATLRYALGVRGTDDEVLAALERIYVEHGSHEALAEVLRRRAELAEYAEDKAQLEHRRGEVLDRDLGRTDEAIALYRHLLGEVDRTHHESVRALQAIFLRRGDWPNLFGAFERELELTLGDAAQAAIVAKMARLASDRLRDDERAIELWGRVLDLRGEDAEALNALGDIHARRENWRDLVDVLDREANVVDDDAQRIRIYADLGRIWYERLGRDRNSLDAWERVLDLDGQSSDALFYIARVHRETEQWHELVDTLNRVAEACAGTLDDHALVAVFIELGRLYSEKLEQPMDAVDAYNRALDVDPRNFAAMEALEAIHRFEGQWEDAIGVMERRVLALPASGDKIKELLSVARMWADSAGAADRGTSAYERVVELDPRHQVAFDRLEVLHGAAGRAEALIGLYLARLDTATDTAERVDMLRRTAKVYEDSVGDRVEAFDALLIAWSENYRDRETAAELERLAAATNKWSDLLTAANAALEQVGDDETKIAICLQCARWYGQGLGRLEYAIPYYETIVRLDPTNAAAYRQMAELYRSTQQWQVLAQTLTALVEFEKEPRGKADTYVQLGELSEEQLGVQEQARSYYKKALDLDAHNLGAIDALERIYRRENAWEPLLDMLRRRVEAVDDDAQRVQARLEVASVLEDQLHRADEAIEEYRRALALDERHLPAMRGLERLYAQKERWTDLVQILEMELEVVETERERIHILVRLAGMLEEEFRKPERAAERLEQVVEIDPLHADSLRSLARLYRQLRAWEMSIRTFERLVEATPDRDERIALFKSIGDVRARELGDVDRAVDAYLEALAIDEDDVEALDALARLYERREEYSSALETMERLARRIREPQAVVDLRYRMGRLYDEHLGDRAAAVEAYERALDADPAHLPSLEAVRRIHVDAGDWLAAARALEVEAKHHQNPRLVAELLVELARIYDERLDEHARAVTAYEEAIRRDADNEDAAAPLVEEYVAHERWQSALPLLQMIFKRSARRSPEEQHRFAFMLGDVSARLGDVQGAIKAFTRAHQLDASHLPSLVGLAAANYDAKDWEKAFKLYQMVLVHHRDSLARDEITDTYYRLGVIKREQGERRKALNMFDKALEEDTHHRPTLEALVALHGDHGEWDQVVDYRYRLLEVVREDERVDYLERTGDVLKEKAKDVQRAIQAYAEAAEAAPKNHKILHKLLAAYQETRNWERAIEVIDRVAGLTDRDDVKAKYHYTVGVILRDELDDADAAVERFNQALDHDSEQLKAFEAINRILTQRKDWKQLERAFRKMLHRVVGKGKTELEFNLWHNLGIIYRDRQQQFDNAAEAFRTASALVPDNATEHQILAELYGQMPSRLEEAISEHQWLLRQDPYRVDSYRALYKLYFDARAYDKAWCLAATLTFLKKADAEQQQFYQQYRQQGMIRPAARLDDERWIKDLFHPDEDLYVGKIFAVLKDAVHILKASPDKALHLAKKYEVDPATSTVTFARTFYFVSQALNLRIVPRLFLRSDTQGGLMHVAGSMPVATVCGASLLSGFSPQDLTFVLGRHLSMYREEHFIRTLLSSSSELKAILLAGIRVAGVGAADPQVDAIAQQLGGKLQPAQVEALRSIGKKFLEAGARTDIKRWIQTTELTACRAGFLLCNDLETAARMIQALPPEGPVDVSPKDKVKEIVLFSVSENYFRLREFLGIQIGV